jgi:hypothetical protein
MTIDELREKTTKERCPKCYASRVRCCGEDKGKLFCRMGHVAWQCDGPLSFSDVHGEDEASWIEDECFTNAAGVVLDANA